MTALLVLSMVLCRCYLFPGSYGHFIRINLYELITNSRHKVKQIMIFFCDFVHRMYPFRTQNDQFLIYRDDTNNKFSKLCMFKKITFLLHFLIKNCVCLVIGSDMSILHKQRYVTV